MAMYQKGKKIYSSVMVNGKRYYLGSFKSRSEANIAEQTLRAKLTPQTVEDMLVIGFADALKVLDKGDGPPKEDITFGQLYRRCRKNWEARDSEHWTEHRVGIVTTHYLPRWKDKKCGRIDREMVEEVLYRRHKEWPAGNVANSDLKILKSMFRYGKAMGWIWNDPTEGIPKFKTRRVRKLRKPTEDEIYRLVNAATGERRDLLIALVATDARWKSITNLKWSDIDWDNRQITVRHSKSHEGEVEETKDINDDLWNALLRQRARNLGSEYVFPSPRGGKREDASKLFASISKKAGIEKINCHALRHFGISHAYRQGGTVQDVMAIAGHKSIGVHNLYLDRRGIKRTPTDLLYMGFDDRASVADYRSGRVKKLKKSAS
jgi:integrase